MRSTTASQPWYRYPIVWLVVAIPASSVLVGALLLTMALRVPESVVRDDYYQAGRAINIDLRESRRAEDLNVEALFTPLDTGGWQLEVSIPESEGHGPQPIELLKVMLAHPTQAHKDVDLTLRPGADGYWLGHVEELSGARNLAIHARQAQWQLRGQVMLREQSEAPIRLTAHRLGIDR